MNASALDDAALDEIARKVKERCNGMLSPDVYRAIIEAGRSARPGNFIEIGTAHGAATVALALGLQARNGGSGSVKIHTVEKIVGGSRVAYGGVDENIAIIRGNFHHFGVSGLIDLHVGTSEAAAGEIPRDEPVSLLMLDADGRIDRDFALYYNRTLPGAIIIIDDCKDMPRVKRMPGGRMRIDLKHKLTFHLVQYFCRKGLIEDLEIINGTAFARKPVSVVEEVTFDFAEIVKVYQELVFSDALFPGIFREVIGRGLKAVHGQVKRRPALYKAWKKGQARVRTWRGGTAEAGVRA